MVDAERGGTVSGWDGMSHTDPGSFPSGLSWSSLAAVPRGDAAAAHGCCRVAAALWPCRCAVRGSRLRPRSSGAAVRWNTYSWDERQRSVTDSGRPFGLAQMMSRRRIRPSWSMQASAYRHGRPSSDLSAARRRRGDPGASPARSGRRLRCRQRGCCRVRRRCRVLYLSPRLTKIDPTASAPASTPRVHATAPPPTPAASPRCRSGRRSARRRRVYDRRPKYGGDVHDQVHAGVRQRQGRASPRSRIARHAASRPRYAGTMTETVSCPLDGITLFTMPIRAARDLPDGGVALVVTDPGTMHRHLRERLPPGTLGEACERQRRMNANPSQACRPR